MGLLRLFLSLLSAGVISEAAILKRVQTGTVNLAGVISTTATIDAVDTSKSFVLATGTTNRPSPRQNAFTFQLTNATTLTFARSQANAAAFPIRYYVFEFSSGVSVQRGMGTLSATTVNRAITDIGTLANGIAIMSYRNNANGSYGTDDFVRGDLSSTTNFQAVSQATSASGFFEYQIINHLNADVQRGTVLFGSGVSSVNRVISQVELGKSWLYYNCDSAAGTTANIGQKSVLGVFVNTGTLNFSRVNTGQAMNCFYQAISFNDRTIVQNGTFAIASAPSAGTISLASPAVLASSGAIGGWTNNCGSTSYSSNDLPAVVCASYSLTDQGTLLLERGATGVTANLPYTVISFPKRRVIAPE